MWRDELRKMKEASGLTTKEISTGANLPEPTLEKIFSGQTVDPKLTTMQQLVHFLGFTLDDLTPESKKKAPAQQELSDTPISVEASTRLLVGLGFIREGEQLSDADLSLLSCVFGILDAWFSRDRG